MMVHNALILVHIRSKTPACSSIEINKYVATDVTKTKKYVKI